MCVMIRSRCEQPEIRYTSLHTQLRAREVCREKLELLSLTKSLSTLPLTHKQFPSILDTL